MKLSEGQKLWWVPQHSLGMKGREVTVLKVGRKWAELDNGERIDLETLISDVGRYAPNGRCYLSQEAYKQAEALVQAWIKLKRDLQYGRIPEDVTIGDIELARLLLGMTSNAKLPKERLNTEGE